ncbi:hypothetical protein KDA11_02375 [Candidatus Saccharibacteria bacterium]|nr:hypothetical protein [Candidatus Saccharibacteria bacterium]
MNAKTTYQNTYQEIKTLQRELTTLLIAHKQEFDGENWGFVGDLTHIAVLLRETTAFLKNEDID